MGDPRSEFSVGQRVGFVISAALTQFRTSLGDLGELVRVAIRDEKSRSRPEELRRLAGELDRSKIRRAETAVVGAYEAATVSIEELRRVDAADQPSGLVRHHPLAPEQIVALLVMMTGRDRLTEIAADYFAACGGDDVANYGFAYIQWIKRPPLSTTL